MHFLLVTLIVVGCLVGFLSGLIGIGGGIVVVPALVLLFDHFGMPIGVDMRMAVGTSLAVMIFTTLRSLLAHLKYKVEFWSIAHYLVLPVGIGVIVSGIIAHYMDPEILRLIFATFLLFVSLRLLLEGPDKKRRTLPRPPVLVAAGFVMGSISGLLGVGGSSTTIPFLSYFDVSMRKAVMVAICVGIVVSIVGTVTFILTGLYHGGLPKYSIGYVNWPAWIVLSVSSMLVAPWGVRFSHHLPTYKLRKIFAVFVLFVCVHMFWSL